MNDVATPQEFTVPAALPIWGSWYLAAVAIPLLVKHMTAAVFERASLSGDRPERFRQAFKIARSQCVKFDLIGPDGLDGPADAIALTSKGTVREAAHRRERDGGPKTALFDELFAVVAELDALADAKARAGSVPGAAAPPGAPKAPRTQRQTIVDRLRDAEERVK